MTAIRIEKVAGMLTVQDIGRPGHLAQGLSRGGAMDRLALIEAAALLGADRPLAAIEMAGAGAHLSVAAPMRIALTGAPMTAMLDDAPLRWHASHLVQPDQTLRIGSAQAGVYGYVTPAGGLRTPLWLDSRAAHLNIGIGRMLNAGDRLDCGDDPAPQGASRIVEPEARFQGGELRVTDGPQTALFDDDVLEAFFSTGFTRGSRANRQGIQLDTDSRFTSNHAAGLASDMIGPGDLQMTGDGLPFVLMAECQTMGGYPRIGRIVPADLPRMAQAPAGSTLRFRRLTWPEADAAFRTEADTLREVAARCRNLIRDPATIPDLLSYQLIGGVTAGRELEAGR
ncbi:urea amidolyase [Paracoccus stylophorae]|uniref:Urea amidolyase n=1 Tax=Paracoccus stylophorae TaxID=659350 RepID=A0ABY7SY73_9RHOB|nr:biotin-dependent carboxyltransferase family protein [Paracoccus stylophorae]WCR11196.1 urea amidolyase [Paracoccus stylophorae]